MPNLLSSYLLIISCVTFIAFGIDKYKAVHQKRRISEKRLLSLVALGGALGGLIGMSVFRHKTQKSAFLRKFWGYTLVWLMIVVLYLYYQPL